MAFSRFYDLTVFDVIAFACKVYPDNQFSSHELADKLRRFIDVRFEVALFYIVESRLECATRAGLLKSTLSERGSLKYSTIASGVKAVAHAPLPDAVLEKLANIEGEEFTQAPENAGLLFAQLQDLISKSRKNRGNSYFFVLDLLDIWVLKACLNSFQVAALGRVAQRHGVTINENLYVGNARPEWVAPYREEKRRIRLAKSLQKREKTLVLEHKRKAQAQEQVDAHKSNKPVRKELSAKDRRGELAAVNALMLRFFPGTNRTDAARKQTFLGEGSRAMRACVAYVAFRKAPSMVWSGTSQSKQPDESSDVWRTLMFLPLQEMFPSLKAINDDGTD